MLVAVLDYDCHMANSFRGKSWVKVYYFNMEPIIDCVSMATQATGVDKNKPRK